MNDVPLDPTKEHIDINQLYELQATLYFGILLGLLGGIFLYISNFKGYLFVAAIGSFILSITAFVILFVEYSLHYILNSWSSLKKSFNNHKLIYGISIVGIILIILLVIGWIKIPQEQFWAIVLGTGIPACLLAIGFLIKRKFFPKN